MAAKPQFINDFIAWFYFNLTIVNIAWLMCEWYMKGLVIENSFVTKHDSKWKLCYLSDLYLYIYLSINPSTHSFIHSFIHPSIHSSIHPSIHPSMLLSIKYILKHYKISNDNVGVSAMTQPKEQTLPLTIQFCHITLYQ